MTAPTMTRPKAKAGSASGKAAPVQPRAFRVGVQSHDEVNYDVTVSTTVSTQDLAVLNIPPAGFLRGVYLYFQGTTAGNAATVTFAQDGPFNAIDTVTLEDVNSAPIIGPFGGYDLYLVNKYGGYSFQDDCKASPTYLATAGAGATGGSFAFVLRLPVELVNRDALGPLPNKSGTAMFKVRTRLAATATIYGVAPTAAPSVRVRMQQVDWWDPDATDLKGRPLAQNPPAVQTTQYWSKAPFTVNAGAVRQGLERVGYLLRNVIFILRDATPSRTVGETDWPDPFILQFEANILMTRLRGIWQHEIIRHYGYAGNAISGGTIDGAEARDSGVYVEPFCLDFGLKPGAETRRGYLPTSSASRLEVQGTIGGSGSHTLTVLTNDVAPASDEAALVV
jgi:hypothetical protein